jgi:hypothetical protein
MVVYCGDVEDVLYAEMVSAVMSLLYSETVNTLA